MRWKFTFSVLAVALIFVALIFTYQGGITGLQITNSGSSGSGSSGGSVGSSGSGSSGGNEYASGGGPKEPVCSDGDIELLYHFNKNSNFGENNNLVNDFSSNDYDATCTGSQCPPHNPSGGKLSGAFNFDGSDDNFKITGFKLADYITIEAWVKPVSGVTGKRMIIWGGDSGGNGFGSQNEMHLHYDYDNKKFGLFVKGSIPSSGSAQDCNIQTLGQNPNPIGGWYHVVARIIPAPFPGFDGNCQLFINGQIVNGNTFSGYSGSNNVAYTSLGRADAGLSYFKGFIDELVIYADQLGDQEILDHFFNSDKKEYCPSVCGNHIWEKGEQCDDGNTVNGDGCSSTCEFEFICGDNVCDSANGETNSNCPVDCQPTNQVPIGVHDLSNCTLSAGWACDLDNPTQPIQVHFYKDGPAGSGEFVGVITADLQSANLCGGNAFHGFAFAIPNKYGISDSDQHTIYAYAIDTAGGANFLLTNSPKTVTCSPDPQPPVLDEDIPTQILVKDSELENVFDLDDYFDDFNGDTLSYNYSNTTQHVEILIDSNGDVSFDIDDWVGLEYVTFYATDGVFVTGSNNVTLNITDENLPPTIDSMTPAQANVNLRIGEVQTFTITKSDPEGNQLFVEWKLNGNIITGLTGDSYTYTSNIEGTHTLTVEVSDTLWEDSFSWTINVVAKQDSFPPSLQIGFCGDGKQDLGEDCSSCAVDVKCSSSAVCRSGVCVPVEQEEPQGKSILFILGFIILALFLILVILLLTYNIVKRRLKNKPQEPLSKTEQKPKVQQQVQNTSELEGYIKKALASGQTRDQLEITLLANGWTQQAVDQAFSKVQESKITPVITPINTQSTRIDTQTVKNINELINYLRKVQIRGYTRIQIEPVLLKKGWPKEVIDEAFKRANS